MQAHGIPLFCQVISYIGKVDSRKRQWCWTENDIYSQILLHHFIITKVSFMLQISDAKKNTQTSGTLMCMFFLGKSRVLLPMQNESIEREIRQIYSTMKFHINKFRRLKSKLVKCRHPRQRCFVSESTWLN